MANEQKTYVPKSSAKLIKFNSGKSIIKIGFHASTLIEFIKAHTNDRGYINIGISERREVGERGDTHCCWLDTWQPGQTAPKASPEAAKRGTEAMREAVNQAPKEDDVPF